MSFVPRHLPPTPVSFSGDRGEFRRLVSRGALLELVTLGFYRFWLATDIRRHLWSNTHIDGDAAEYTGRGKELLIGFLFALAILVPIYLAYFLVGLEAERNRQLSSSPLCDLSRATLSPHAHGVARGAVLDGWLGLGLCGASGIMGDADAAHPWADLAVA
jgi:hypothetical protein